MSVKAQLTGTVVSDKMEKTVVVAVERQVRHGLYGKSQRKTSKFVAHNEANEAKVGDTVAIAESRPLSRRKRWIVTRVVAKAQIEPAATDGRQGTAMIQMRAILDVADNSRAKISIINRLADRRELPRLATSSRSVKEAVPDGTSRGRW